MKCSISNIANVISESIPNPAESGFDIFVGLEHYDSGEVKVTRYGSTQNLVTAVKVFRKGDILLARRNVYLKRAGLVDFDGVTSGDSIVLRVKDDLSSLSLQSEDIRMYLPFVLNTEEFWNYAEKYSDGTMSKRLSPKTLLQYEFDIPDDVTEKNRLLWQAYKTKESYKAMILATDEMVKSQFIGQFGSIVADKKLSDIAEIYDGVHQTPHYTDSGVKFISVEDISDIYASKKYISVGDYSKYKHVPDLGDLIMTRIGTIGMCAVVSKSEPLAYYVSVTLIKPDHSVIDSTYLKYYIESDYGQSELRMRSLLEAFPMKINLNEIGKIAIKVPALDEQRAFVSIVKQADKSKFDGLKSQFIEKIGDSRSNPKGWDIYTLRELVVPSCPISYGIVQPGEDIEEGGVPIVRPVDLDDTHWVTAKGLKRTTKEISDAYRRTILDGNELLLCVRGTTGLVGLATEELKGCNVTRGITPLSFNERVDRVFMLCMFLSDGIQEFISDNTIGSALRAINMAVIREMKFPVPPIDIQRSFASLYEQADKSKYLS